MGINYYFPLRNTHTHRIHSHYLEHDIIVNAYIDLDRALVLQGLWPFTDCMSVFVCVCEHAEQPGTAHWVINEADTQSSAIPLQHVVIHYSGVIQKKKKREIHTMTQIPTL